MKGIGVWTAHMFLIFALRRPNVLPTGDLGIRAAIRKAYIALLCELGDRKVISLAQHKTNRDYLSALRGRTRLHSTMRGLTNSFEQHWYGFVPAGENDWSDFRNGYQQAVMSEK